MVFNCFFIIQKLKGERKDEEELRKFNVITFSFVDPVRAEIDVFCVKTIESMTLCTVGVVFFARHFVHYRLRN